MMPRVFVGLAIYALASCSSCRSPSATEPPDHSETDAITDGTPSNDSAIIRDGTPDDAVEAGDDDAPPFFGSWTALAGAPPECGRLMSSEPTKAAPPLKWTACASGRAGCRQLEVDWTTRPGTPFRLPRRPVAVSSGQKYLHYTRELGKIPDDTKYRFLTVWSALDGDAKLVLRMDFSRPTCAFAASVGGFGFGAIGHTADATSQFIVALSWAAKTPTVTPFDLTSLGAPKPAGVQRVATSAADLFLEAFSPEGVGVFHFATATVSPRKASVEAVDGTLEGAVGINFATNGLAFVAPDSSSVDLVVPSSKALVTEVAVDHANADALVWAESTYDSTSGSYKTPSLWTSPYAKEPSAMKPRRFAVPVDTLGAGAAGMVANAGMVLVQTNTSTATLIRVSDGAGWSISAEPDQVVIGPVWVDEAEVIVGVKPTGRPGGPISLQRLRREVLGTPTISSGL